MTRSLRRPVSGHGDQLVRGPVRHHAGRASPLQIDDRGQTDEFRSVAAKNVRFVSRCDQGGRPDGVQVIVHKGHAFIGHMFSDGYSVVDVRDPRNPKTVAFVAAPKNTRSHHLQSPRRHPARRQRSEYLGHAAICEPGRLLREVAGRDSVQTEQPFGAGMRVFDVSQPAKPREIGFLNTAGLGAHRIWWVGGRYAYVSVHFEGFIDHVAGGDRCVRSRASRCWPDAGGCPA